MPTDLMAEYYKQRSSAGLIMSEATSVSAMGVGYPNTPGIWSDEQVEGWKKVTKAVHDGGGLIQLQLWHVGRISDPLYLDGKLPLAPSEVAAKGHVSLVRPKKDYVTPRAISVEEINEVVQAEPSEGQDPEILGQLASIGIKKGQPFKPDEWLQTVPGKGWNMLFRLYGPLQPWFDKSWRPGDPVEVK